VKCAAGPRFALDPDPATHQLRQMGADRQAQTGSPVVASMRAVGLTEWLKDQLLLVDGNPHAGVDYSEMHEIDARFAPNFEAEVRAISRCSRCSPERLVSRTRLVIPIIPFIGVRISWLMFARNPPLAATAFSATRRAARAKRMCQRVKLRAPARASMV